MFKFRGILLCLGRRLHDLTLLNVDFSNCIIDDDSPILWPSFGSKTDFVNYRQSGWKLVVNNESEKLDAVFWVKHTLSLKNRKNAAKTNGLFLNIREDPRAVVYTSCRLDQVFVN